MEKGPGEKKFIQVCSVAVHMCDEDAEKAIKLVIEVAERYGRDEVKTEGLYDLRNDMMASLGFEYPGSCMRSRKKKCAAISTQGNRKRMRTKTAESGLVPQGDGQVDGQAEDELQGDGQAEDERQGDELASRVFLGSRLDADLPPESVIAHLL
jgi:hypothetical protein